uniref:GTP-binding protein n=1 Tax=Pseudogulbenkiania ferrooxidans TaxID=549169 RepID=UPI0019177D46
MPNSCCATRACSPSLAKRAAWCSRACTASPAFDYGRAWQDDETPRCDIVLIGQQLPADAIRAEFAACLA